MGGCQVHFVYLAFYYEKVIYLTVNVLFYALIVKQEFVQIMLCKLTYG